MAGANFGFNYIINSEYCGTNYLTGSRVSIDAPAYNFGPTAATGDIARVVAENDDPSSGSAMLVQIGMAQTNGFGYDQCGGRTTLTNFWEYKPYSTSTTNYTCAWLSSIGTQGDPLQVQREVGSGGRIRLGHLPRRGAPEGGRFGHRGSDNRLRWWRAQLVLDMHAAAERDDRSVLRLCGRRHAVATLHDRWRDDDDRRRAHAKRHGLLDDLEPDQPLPTPP